EVRTGHTTAQAERKRRNENTIKLPRAGGCSWPAHKPRCGHLCYMGTSPQEKPEDGERKPLPLFAGELRRARKMAVACGHFANTPIDDRKSALRQHLPHDLPLDHTRQPLVEAVVEEGQAPMVEAHQMQDGGVQITDVATVFDAFKA